MTAIHIPHLPQVDCSDEDEQEVEEVDSNAVATLEDVDSLTRGDKKAAADKKAEKAASDKAKRAAKKAELQAKELESNAKDAASRAKIKATQEENTREHIAEAKASGYPATLDGVEQMQIAQRESEEYADLGNLGPQEDESLDPMEESDDDDVDGDEDEEEAEGGQTDDAADGRVVNRKKRSSKSSDSRCVSIR